MVLCRFTSARSLGGAEVPSSRMALGASLVKSPQSGIVQPIIPHCQVGSGDSQCERRLRDIPEDAWKKTTLRCGNILPQPRDLHSSTLELATDLLLGGLLRQSCLQVSASTCLFSRSAGPFSKLTGPLESPCEEAAEGCDFRSR